MPNLAFERPIFVIVALLSPFAIALARRFLRDAFTLSLSLGPPEGEAFDTPIRSSFMARFIRFLRTMGVIALFLAVSGPFLIKSSYVYIDRGADILFVLDDSPSMAALDIGGSSRFDAARRLLHEFARKRPADAIGLAISGDDAALLVPPTTDRNALLTRLDALNIGEAGDGTALGMGLSVAALHLRSSVAPRKAVVLVTDGENNSGAIHPETAAQELKKDKIMLYVVAVGTTGEVPVDYVDPRTHVRRTGTFDSRFNTDALMRIALAADGVFIPAPSADSFSEAFSRIHKDEITVSRKASRSKNSPVHSFFLVAGLLLLSGSFIFRRLFLGAFL